MNDQLANVRFGKNKTEAEILSGGANSIIAGQTWIASDTKRIIHRRKDNSQFEFVKADIGEPVPVNGVPYAWNGNTWVSLEDQTFLGLSDTPSDYTGAAGKRVMVTEAEDGLEFVEDPFKPLVGVDENKNYVTKVDENTISIASGTGTNRKSDLSEYKVSWTEIPSVDVSFLLDGQLRWVVFQNNSGQTGVELTFLTVAPATLDEAEQYQWVGRIWRENGVLQVGDRHIMLSVDPQVNRTNVWQFPAGNVSVTVSNAADVGLLSISSGEVTRWPVVELGTFHHVWKYNGMPSVISMWDHVQGSSGFTIISDNGAGDTTDIRTIPDYYDNNGNLELVPTNDFVAHLIGVYAGSEERVLFRGQKTYNTLADAELGISIDPLNESQWVSDLRQVSKLAWMIVKRGTRDFSDPADCVFVPYSLLGSGGGSGTTPNLAQVLAVGGDVDITDSLDTDRVMSFIKDGERILSVLGSGEVASALSSIADLRVGLLQAFNRFVSLGRSQFGNASDTGATISVVDQSGIAGELFTVDDFVSDTEGLYTLSAQVDVDYGEPCYEFTSGSGTTYYAYKGNVNTEAYWFVGTTILTGNTAFTNCQYRSTQPVALPSALPSDAPAYDGVNAPDIAQQGVFRNQSGTASSISAETIVSKNTFGIITGTTTQAELQALFDSGVTVFNIDAGAGKVSFPSGTYTLQNRTYYFNGGDLEEITVPAGGVTFRYPSLSGWQAINFNCSLLLLGTLTVTDATDNCTIKRLSPNSTQSISFNSSVYVEYLTEYFSSGTLNNGGVGTVFYQFKDAGVTVGTGIITQQNWKYPITQS